MVLTGVAVGAAIWKGRKGQEASGDTGPFKNSIADLESRLTALERFEPATAAASSQPDTSAQQVAASFEAKVESMSARFDARFHQLEAKVAGHDTRLFDHEAKLKEMPTLTQIISTMEEMLAGTMTGLDQKIADQVRSIEVLKTTVSQSDELMERVLDSIYSLQSHVAESDKPEVPVSV